MLFEKVIRFHENEKQKARREAPPLSTSPLDEPRDRLSSPQLSSRVGEQDERNQDYIDPGLLRKASSYLHTVSMPSQPASLQQSRVAPTAAMMLTTVTSQSLDGTYLAGDTNWNSSNIASRNQQHVNSFGRSQDIEWARYQPSSKPHPRQVNRRESSSASDTGFQGVSMARKHPRSQDDDGNSAPRKAQKQMHVKNFDCPNPKLLVKLKLPSEKLASITNSEQVQRNKRASSTSIPLAETEMDGAGAQSREEDGQRAFRARDNANIQCTNDAPFQQKRSDAARAWHDQSSAIQKHLARELAMSQETSLEDDSTPRSRPQSRVDRFHRDRGLLSTGDRTIVSESALPDGELQHVMHKEKSLNPPSPPMTAEKDMTCSNLSDEGSEEQALIMEQWERRITTQPSGTAETTRAGDETTDLHAGRGEEREEEEADPALTGIHKSGQYTSSVPASPDCVLIKAEVPNKHETAPRFSEPQSALERAKVSVHWDSEPDFPSFIVLRRCKTYEDFFAQLRHHRPRNLQDRAMKSAAIRLTNAEAAGITESPNCRMPEDDGEGAFDHLTDVLRKYSSEVRAELKVTVEFWD